MVVVLARLIWIIGILVLFYFCFRGISNFYTTAKANEEKAKAYDKTNEEKAKDQSGNG